MARATSLPSTNVEFQLTCLRDRGCFSRGGQLAGQREEHKVQSEEDVFIFVGLPFLEPWDRE